jgi:hypothetical protein
LTAELEYEGTLEVPDNTSLTQPLSLEDQMSARIKRAIKSDNDVAIVSAWKPEYEQQEELRPYIQRVELAKQRCVALEQFRLALESNDYTTIVRNFDPVLNAYSSIQPMEWQRLNEAVAFVFRSCIFGQGIDERWLQAVLLRHFVNACRVEDDTAIIATFQALQDAGYIQILDITSQEKDRVERAKRRTSLRQQFQAVLHNGLLKEIADAYDKLIVRNGIALTTGEQQQAEWAVRFVYALKAHERGDESLVTPQEDKDLLAVFEEIHATTGEHHLQFTEYEQKRMKRAQQRIIALQSIRTALQIGRLQEIFEVWTSVPLLNENHLRADEQARLRYAIRYIKALQIHGNSPNHPDVIDIFKDIKSSPYSNQIFFPPAQIPDSLGKAPDKSQPGGITAQEEISIVAIVNGVPVYYKQFWQVYLVKQQYILLRQEQGKTNPRQLHHIRRWIQSQKSVTQDIQSISEEERRKISEQVLYDIADDFSMKKDISGLPQEDMVAIEKMSNKLFDDFKQRGGFFYQQFLQTYQLTGEEIKAILALYGRREFLAEDLPKRNQGSIDSWLKSQRGKLSIEYPSQDIPEEAKESKRLGRLLWPFDWFGA